MRPSQRDVPVPMIVDIGIDVAASLTRTAVAVTRTGLRVSRPLVDVLMRPPLIAPRYWPQTRLLAMAERGRELRTAREKQADALLGEVVPVVVNMVLDRLDLTQLVLDRVQIEKIVDSVDLDAVVATVDLDAAVDRVSIERIIDRVDIDEIVANVDLAPIIARVDVDGIAAKIDLDAIIGRVDILGIAQDVIDGVDLPEIIRDSTGAVASETVVGVRMRGIEADERVNRLVDRLILRRHGRDSAAPTSKKQAAADRAADAAAAGGPDGTGGPDVRD
ncbi:hypothetical protein SAMN05444157_1458 [Frankineae bacterium MT45]|nr:hypothetical protein SAMN05444157_1458 [Frankineae bacterium MT45]